MPKTSANIIFRVQTDVKRHEECKNVKIWWFSFCDYHFTEVQIIRDLIPPQRH